MRGSLKWKEHDQGTERKAINSYKILWEWENWDNDWTQKRKVSRLLILKLLQKVSEWACRERSCYYQTLSQASRNIPTEWCFNKEVRGATEGERKAESKQRRLRKTLLLEHQDGRKTPLDKKADQSRPELRLWKPTRRAIVFVESDFLICKGSLLTHHPH